MHIRKNIHVIVLIVGLVALLSCEYEKIVPEMPDPNDPVSYSGQIQPIWNKSCIGCHGAGATPPDLSEANSYSALTTGGYVNLNQPDQSSIYLSMKSGGSMSQYSNSSEAGLVLNWITQGAKNN
jgi:mono/diheme cytochrome c family protein